MGNYSHRLSFTNLMQADELVLDLSVTPEPDGAVVTGRNEDVDGQLLN